MVGRRQLEPAVSADGSHWFDGTGWRPRFAPQQSRSRPLMVVLLVVGLIVGGIAVMALYIRATGEAHDARSLYDARIREAADGCSGITQALNGQVRTVRSASLRATSRSTSWCAASRNWTGVSWRTTSRHWTGWRLGTPRHRARGLRRAPRREQCLRFKIPETDDGYPITQRLIDVAPPECERAVTLASQP